METQRIKLVAKAHEGHIIIHAEVAVSGDADTYVANIDVEPQSKTPGRGLDELYGALSDTPMSDVR